MASYTISMWFKIDDLSKANNMLLNSSPHPQFAISYNHDFSNSRLSYWLSNSPTESIIWTPSGLQGTKTNYQQGTWYNEVATKDNGSYAFYVDAVLDGVISTNNVFALPDASLYFGSASFLGEYLAGTLDDIYIYNRVLSSNEISALYTGASPIPAPATIWLLSIGLVSLIVKKPKEKQGTRSAVGTASQ